MSLEEGRAKAAEWRKLIKRGVDPGAHEAAQRLSEEHRRANTFVAVAEDFIAEKLPDERKGREVERDIRREFIEAWGKRPIADITSDDVLDVIEAKAKTAPAQARNMLGLAKRLFAWATNTKNRRRYGLPGSPARDLKPADVVGEKKTGSRVLSDPELFALWRAATRTPYPHGPVYQLLALTALRLNEAADAAIPEFDFRNRVWTIPANRMKGKNGKARPHAVPLTDGMLQIIGKLPDFREGSYLFSTTFGDTPAWMTDKVKRRIDARMLRTLRALARLHGDHSTKVELPPWTNHDIRRTVRSNLSRLKISEEAREAVMAHARPGIKGVYDHHDYLDEKFEALDLWAAHLRSIVESRAGRV
jgi:integrase